MSSWLSKRLGVHINFRPLVRPAAAIAGGLFGGPLGASLASGLAGAADDLGHGKNLGQAAVGGLKTGALTYAGAKLLPAIAGKLGMGDDAASSGSDVGGGGGVTPAGAETAMPPAARGTVNIGGFTAPAPVAAEIPSSSAALPSPEGNLAQRALKSVGGFVKQNPVASINAAGTALSTYANASGANADRRLYRDQLMRQNALEDEERKRRQSIGTAWLQSMKNAGNPFALDLAKQLGYG